MVFTVLLPLMTNRWQTRVIFLVSFGEPVFYDHPFLQNGSIRQIYRQTQIKK